jgi:hypothetical protein
MEDSEREQDVGVAGHAHERRVQRLDRLGGATELTQDGREPEPSFAILRREAQRRPVLRRRRIELTPRCVEGRERQAIPGTVRVVSLTGDELRGSGGVGSSLERRAK